MGVGRTQAIVMFVARAVAVAMGMDMEMIKVMIVVVVMAMIMTVVVVVAMIVAMAVIMLRMVIYFRGQFLTIDTGFTLAAAAHGTHLFDL